MAAAETIQVDYDALDQLSLQARHQAEAIEELYQRTQRQAERLSDAWAGEGARAFQGEMAEAVLPSLRRLGLALGETGEAIVRINALMHAAEEEAAGLMPREVEGAQSSFLEWVHGILDAAGLIPATGVGEAADAVNALIYLSELRFKEAGISAVSILPFGDLAKAGKYVVRYGDEAASLAARGGKELLGEAGEVALRRAGAEQYARAGSEFKGLRNAYADRLGVGPFGQVHHSVELQVLKKYPGVYSPAEVNDFANMRGIPREIVEKKDFRQLHNSKIREVWDRHYAELDDAIQSGGLTPGTAEYDKMVRFHVENGRAEMDWSLGQFFSEYRTGRVTDFPFQANPPPTKP